MISCINPIICTTGCISCYIFPIYIPMLMAIFLNSPLFANFQLLVLCHHNLMNFWVSYFSEVQLENIHRFLLVSLPTFLPMHTFHVPSCYFQSIVHADIWGQSWDSCPWISFPLTYSRISLQHPCPCLSPCVFPLCCIISVSILTCSNFSHLRTPFLRPSITLQQPHF